MSISAGSPAFIFSDDNRQSVFRVKLEQQSDRRFLNFPELSCYLALIGDINLQFRDKWFVTLIEERKKTNIMSAAVCWLCRHTLWFLLHFFLFDGWDTTYSHKFSYSVVDSWIREWFTAAGRWMCFLSKHRVRREMAEIQKNMWEGQSESVWSPSGMKEKKTTCGSFSFFFLIIFLLF